MHRSRIVTGALAVLLLAGAGVAEVVTWLGGTELGTVALSPSGSAWTGTLANVAVPAGTPVVLDLSADYDYQGDVELTLEGILTSARGERAQLVASAWGDDGGVVAAQHARSDAFTAPSASVWSGAFALRTTGDLHLTAATATLRAGPIELEWLALLLGLPGLLLLVGALISQRVEWRGSGT